jgi:hypothetical protein
LYVSLKNKKKSHQYSKYIRNNVKELYSIANIINLNDDNARASRTLQMNNGKQKVIIDSNFVEIQ